MSGVLADRVAIVMGGASGLGEAISHRFAVEGAAVVVADIDGTGAERVAMEIRAAGNAAASAPCDVRNRADVEATVEVAKVMGRLGVLVLSAAIESFTPVADLRDDEWQRVLGVNLTGPFLCMRAAIPVMVANGGGSVIALGSTLGLIV